MKATVNESATCSNHHTRTAATARECGGGVTMFMESQTIKAGLIEMTIPDKSSSRLQKYRVTALGKATINAKSSE